MPGKGFQSAVTRTRRVLQSPRKLTHMGAMIRGEPGHATHQPERQRPFRHLVV
jgi:hypothetical protein